MLSMTQGMGAAAAPANRATIPVVMLTDRARSFLDLDASSLYEALARHAVQGREDAVAGPAVSVGFTDSLYARAKGTRAYGFVPFALTRDEVSTMHAPEERVSVENVHRGLRVLFSVVLEVAAAPGLPDVPPEGR